MPKRHRLGNGILGWNSGERVTDRYGSVLLSDTRLKEQWEGKRARLYAVVIETRKSGHFGDWARGLYPETPNVGERIDFGEGIVFYKDGSVGLKPEDGRESDWLDPHKLYRAHDQTVDLFLELI